MKSKIAFFLLGAMLAIGSYSIGDLTANTKERVFDEDVIIKGNLSVSGTVLVSTGFTEEKLGPSIQLTAVESKDGTYAQISLLNGLDLNDVNKIGRSSIVITVGEYQEEENVCEILLMNDDKFESVKVD